jgi:hypothetical protein
MADHRLDHAIDRAVREMMDVDAEPAFRARVFNRLERPGPSSRWRGALAVPSAALVLLILFVATREPRSTPAPVVVVEAPAAPRAVPPEPARSERPARTIPRRAPVATRGPAPMPNVTQELAPGSVMATVAPAPEAVPAAQFTPATAMPLIQVAPIELPPIDPPAIVIAPLTPIAEVQVAPLSPLDRRN